MAQFSPRGGYAPDEVEEESDAFLDAVRNGLDTQTKRIVRIIDNRFRSHARRMRRVERRMDNISALVDEVRLLRRIVVGVIAIVPPVVAISKLVEWF